MVVRQFDGRGEHWQDWAEKFIEYGWERKHLDAGDFFFLSHDEKTVGIESKTVKDLTSRIGDARRELAQLTDTVDIPILVVFGPWNRQSNDILIGGSPNLTWSQLWNLIQSFQDSGLRFQLATSREHAFQRINQLYAYYQKPEHTSTLVARRADNDKRIASLMPVPGVSKKLGTALIGRFSSLQAVVNASVADLQTVPLIGPSKARTIYDWFHREGAYK